MSTHEVNQHEQNYFNTMNQGSTENPMNLLDYDWLMVSEKFTVFSFILGDYFISNVMII